MCKADHDREREITSTRQDTRKKLLCVHVCWLTTREREREGEQHRHRPVVSEAGLSYHARSSTCLQLRSVIICECVCVCSCNVRRCLHERVEKCEKSGHVDVRGERTLVTLWLCSTVALRRPHRHSLAQLCSRPSVGWCTESFNLSMSTGVKRECRVCVRCQFFLWLARSHFPNITLAWSRPPPPPVSLSAPMNLARVSYATNMNTIAQVKATNPTGQCQLDTTRLLLRTKAM